MEKSKHFNFDHHLSRYIFPRAIKGFHLSQMESWTPDDIQAFVTRTIGEHEYSELFAQMSGSEFAALDRRGLLKLGITSINHANRLAYALSKAVAEENKKQVFSRYAKQEVLCD